MKAWSPRARRTLAVLAALAAAQVLAIVAYRSVRERKAEAAPSTFEVEALVGDPAPTLDLERPDGSRIRWTELRGKPVLVHFWASWCTPCRREIPALLELARKREDTLRVLAISLDDDWPAVRLFFDAAIPAQVSRTSASQAQARYAVTTLPDTFVVSASGALIARVRGPRDWRSVEADRALQAWEGTHSP